MGLFDGLFKKKNQNNDQYYLVFNKGKEYHDSGDFKKAIKYYSQAISINPNLPEAYANRAALYGGDTNCRNYQESIKDFNKAINLFDETEDRFIVNSNLKLLMLYCERGRSKYFTKDFKGSLDDFTMSIEVFENLEAYLNRGYCYWHGFNNLEAAISDFKKVLNFLEEHEYEDSSEYKSQSYTALSVLYYKIAVEKGESQKFKEAIIDLDIAIAFNGINKLNPEIKQLENCYYNRGLFNSKLNNFSEAINDFNKVIETSPQDKDALFNRGLNLLSLENIKSARLDFELVKKIDPNRKGLAEILESLDTIDLNNSEQKSFSKNKYSKIPDFTELESLIDWQGSFDKEHDQTNYDYLEFIDKYLKEKDNFSENTKKDLVSIMSDYGNSIISIEGEEIEALYNLAKDKLLTKDIDDAIKGFGNLIIVAPSLAFAYYGRAVSYIIKSFTEFDDATHENYIEYVISDLRKAELLNFHDAYHVRNSIQLAFYGGKYFGPESTLWECAKNIYKLDNVLKALASSDFKEKGTVEILENLDNNIQVFSSIMKEFEKQIDAKKLDSFRNQFYTLKSFFGQVNFNIGFVYTMLTRHEIEGISKDKALIKSDEYFDISVQCGNKSVEKLLGVENNISKFNNETLEVAVMDWIKDPSGAEVKYGHISNWNTSDVTNMCELFSGATSFNQPIENWDVSNVTDMNAMFMRSRDFNQPIEKWNVSNVINMNKMFYGATSFNQSLENWDVSNVTDMNAMFMHSRNFNQSLENWDVSNVINMNKMFCRSKFNKHIGNWSTSKVTDMVAMFMDSRNFNQSLENWDVSNVINMTLMFSGATSFNQPLENWDVSMSTKMGKIFSGTELIEKYGINGQFLKSQKKETIVDQYKIDNELPESVSVSNESPIMYKRDMTGLVAYFKDMPNAERLFNELSWAIRNGSDVEKYLKDANLLEDKEIKNIGITMFKDIAGFLDDMLKINHNSELRKDRDACVEAVKILTNI
jgi:surface protein